MSITKFLRSKSDEFGVEVTRQARELGLIGPDKEIQCKLINAVGMHRELVYPITLSDQDKSEILGGNWQPRPRGILEALVERNGRSVSEMNNHGFWMGAYLAMINATFRDAGKQFRIFRMTIGDPSNYEDRDKDQYWLVTIKKNGNKPLYCIRHNKHKKSKVVFK